jgi:enterochelin esterase-like enzyme
MSDNPLFRRTIVRHDVPSRELPEGSRSIRVYLPPGYQAWISYPVVYCQDGEDFFNFGRIATQAQRLILEEGWDPFIIVGVDVDKTKRTSEYSPDGDRHEAYVRFFAEELIPWVESQYPVRDMPTDRILAGDSLGGTVSLSIALKYPNLSHQIISLSGAYYDAAIDELKQANDLSSLHLWMIVGLQEMAYETDRGIYNFVKLNRTAREWLLAKKAKVFYKEQDGEHKWGFWQQVLQEALGAFLGPTPLAFE